MTGLGLRCEWCDAPIERTGSRGPTPRYCKPAHRQAAHRARKEAEQHHGALSVEAERTLNQLAVAMQAPGEYAPVTVWLAAKDVLEATGRVVFEEPDDVAPPAAMPLELVGRTVRRRPRPKVELARPAKVNPRWYERAFHQHGDRGDWEIRVRPLRKGRPYTDGKPLWRRYDRESGKGAYDFSDRWGTPDLYNLGRLASALVTDALDLQHRPMPSELFPHFAGDVLYPLGDTPWRLTTEEIVAWLDTHGYLTPKPVT